LLILRTSKERKGRGRVLFINGEHLFKPGRNQNTLQPEHAAALLDAYESFTDIEGRSRVVNLTEIASNDYNLSIPLYVAPAETGDRLTLAKAVANLEAAHARSVETRAALEAELAKWGLGVAQEVSA
jgi:type I restriction enzyme M protein